MRMERVWKTWRKTNLLKFLQRMERGDEEVSLHFPVNDSSISIPPLALTNELISPQKYFYVSFPSCLISAARAYPRILLLFAGDDFDSGEAPKFKPKFSPLTAEQMVPFPFVLDCSLSRADVLLVSPSQAGRAQLRRVPVPAHRMSPLKKDWVDLTTPIVKHMKLQVRMNLKRKAVELKTSQHTTDPGALQKVAFAAHFHTTPSVCPHTSPWQGADFIKAYLLGFALKDAIAILRMDDLYVDSFQLDDVSRFNPDITLIQR